MLPALQTAFGVGYAQVQVSVSAYLLALACSQLLVGVVSDRFGRQRVRIIGLLLFVGSSWAMSLAGDIATVVVLRFVQGASASTGMVVALAVTRAGRAPGGRGA